MSAPKLDTLPDRMRFATDVLEEATRPGLLRHPRRLPNRWITTTGGR